MTPTSPRRPLLWTSLLAALLSALLTPSQAQQSSGGLGGLLGGGTSGCGINMSCPGTGGSSGSGSGSGTGIGIGGGTGGGFCPISGTGNTCGSDSGTASQNNATGLNTGAGNPINILSGNKYQKEVDLPTLPGVLGLEIVRHYNSEHALPGVAPSAFGRGWRLSYDTRLYVTPRTLQIIQADGARVMFNRDPKDPSKCSTQDPSRGLVRVHTQAGKDSYVWHWPNGRQLFFDAQGRLTQILAPTGEFVTLSRDPQGRLLQVTDPQGRSLVLHYAALQGESHFRGVASIDSPVGRFTYRYGSTKPAGAMFDTADSKFNLVQVGYPAAITANADPAVPTSDASASPAQALGREYHYEDTRRLNLLTGITVSGPGDDGQPMRQRIGTYVYDERGRGIRSVPGPLPAEGHTASGEIRLDHDQPGKKVLTNSLGQQTTYVVDVIGGEYRLLETRGPGCASCGPTNMRYRYDALGRLNATTTLDSQGRPVLSEQVQFDTQQRPLKVVTYRFVQGKPVPQHWLRYEYAGDALVPELIARPSVVPGQEHQLHIRWNAAGQPVHIEERGHVPATGSTPAAAIQRSVDLRYQTLNGRSVLVAIDGPLPNGPTQSPTDSDITTLQWDARGSFITAVHAPGDLRSEITTQATTGLLQRVVNDAGFATEFRYNPHLQPTEISSQGPGGSAPRVLRHEYNALQQPVQSFVDQRPTERQAFDLQGRLLWHATALGLLNTYRYDSEGQLLQRSLRNARMVQTLTLNPDEKGQLSKAADTRPPQADPTATTAARHDPGTVTVDDFGRPVSTHSPDSGDTLRSFDAADRLVQMRDALGHTATYTYDPQGRILSQTITDTRGSQPTQTQWRYNARQLLEVVHPTQRERFEYDPRGLRSARLVTLNTPQGELTSITRYEHDEHGTLVASTLPDGSRLVYQRNGQGQVVALHRETVHTPWLRWLGKSQTIADGFQRDLVGLSSYTSGNGIQALYQRSAQGVLARVVYRHNSPARTLQAEQAPSGPRLGYRTQELMEQLLGVQPAVAQTAPAPSDAAATAATPAAATAQTNTLPGALGVPHDPQALIDRRYLWSSEGLLLVNQQRAGSASEQSQYQQAYDLRGQLVASVLSTGQSDRPSGTGSVMNTGLWRYAYDAQQRRVLSQQGQMAQDDLVTHTQRHRFESGSHRWQSGSTDAGSPRATYNANGQPERIGERELVWDALGRLIEVRQAGKPLAQYRYDHRGLRLSKTVWNSGADVQSKAHTEPDTTYTLYDESRQPLAELNAQGQLQRQYLYLANLPLAVLDTPQGEPLAADLSGAAQVWADLQHIVQDWLSAVWSGDTRSVVWLHTNHLGAPEAATDARGDLVWRAAYSPFGSASVTANPAKAWVLNLRLPGQMYDAETGLHYNRQRYYDPDQGLYLTPDPLGTPNGPNPYAYVAFNPSGFVDPDGLVLFAFDGTENTDDMAWLKENNSDLSNVVLFRNAYANGSTRYITGVGTDFIDSTHGNITTPFFDAALNITGVDRINRMKLFFDEEASLLPDDKVMEVDIIGFSRGAAEARDFANQIVKNSFTSGGKTYYKYSYVQEENNPEGLVETRCQLVNFRFMGLWDTVLSTNSRRDYNLSIPSEFKYVAQAVALNEYRSQPAATWNALENRNFYSRTRTHLPGSRHWGGFPLESIGASSSTPGQVRIERGFIGAHADIGGGYASDENGLSTVALSWMVAQAQQAGVTMDTSTIKIKYSSPIIHDPSNLIRFGNPEKAPSTFEVDGFTYGLLGTVTYPTEDRIVRGGLGGGTQRTQTFGYEKTDQDRSLVNSETHGFITYTDRPKDINSNTRNSEDIPEIKNLKNQTGKVNMTAYMKWLTDHGYKFSGTVNP